MSATTLLWRPLSVLTSRYRPAGLTVATDEQLQSLLAEIDAWKAKLPEDLSFHGPDTPRNAGEYLGPLFPG